MKDEAIYRGSFQDALQLVAPGTTFRLGLENILKARTGALLVVGDSPEVLDLVSGGFRLDCELTPANLYELAKMDGAIVLNKDASRILVANKLFLDPSYLPPKPELTPYRRKRVARDRGTGTAISQRRSIVTLFKGAELCPA